MLKRLKYVFVFLLVLLTAVIICSCGMVTSTVTSNFTVGQEYFTTQDVTFTKSKENSSIATAEYSVVCACNLYEYTATFSLLDKDGEELFKSETVTFEGEVSANESFTLSFDAPYGTVEAASTHTLELRGKTKESPALLTTKIFKVSYMYNNEVLRTEKVRGGNTVNTEALSYKNMIFTGLYNGDSLSCRTKVSAPIYRDTVLYVDFAFDGEKVTNEITTSYIKSLVSIRCERIGFISKEIVTGSGVIFKEDAYYYYVLTNHHVVGENNTYNLQAYDYKNNSYSAQIYSESVSASSKEFDLAVLKIRKGEEILKCIKLAEKDLGVGAGCISLGYPNGQKNAITFGTTTGYADKVDGHRFTAMKHTALVNHGCSGGPLLNDKLELVGINYAKVGNDDSFSGGFAIPLSSIIEFLEEYTSILD